MEVHSAAMNTVGPNTNKTNKVHAWRLPGLPCSIPHALLHEAAKVKILQQRRSTSTSKYLTMSKCFNPKILQHQSTHRHQSILRQSILRQSTNSPKTGVHAALHKKHRTMALQEPHASLWQQVKRIEHGLRYLHLLTRQPCSIQAGEVAFRVQPFFEVVNDPIPCMRCRS